MKRNLSDITKIIVHCSDTRFGDVNQIDRWHKEMGWDGCGYHYVITNGILHAGQNYDSAFDGMVQRGRGIEVVGAHVKGHNHDSIGVCLIGQHHFTGRQLLLALPTLLLRLKIEFPNITDIYGHREFNKEKTCPNIAPRLIHNLWRQQ